MTQPTSLLVATIKNEGPNILEWVAHHRLCGFDRIQIYQNDSTDTTVQTLRTLKRLGVIEFFENRHNKGAHQMRAYRRASRTSSYSESDWCMVLDGDEFLSIKTGDGKVSDLIATVPDADAFLVNWRVFGSNGLRELGRELVIERFTHAEPASDIVDTHLTPFKPLFRTSSFARPGIHLPRDPRKSELVYANASGLTNDDFFRKNWRSYDPKERQFAQVNHYAVRDLASFLLKHDRGSANAPHRNVSDAYWVQHDRNDEEDLGLSQTAPDVMAEMHRLDEMSDGQLLRLRNRAFRQWRIGLEALLERPMMAALRNSILAADQGIKGEDNMIAPFRLPGRQPVFSSTRTPSGKMEEIGKRKIATV